MKVNGNIMLRYSKMWIFAGLLTLEGLILLPTQRLMTISGGVTLPWETPMAFFTFSLPALGLFITAFLFYSGLKLYPQWRKTDPTSDWESHLQHRQAGWSAFIALILCLLLFAKALYNLYWLLLWDKTADGIGYGWLLFTPLPVAFVTGLMLVVALEGRQKLAGFLYLFLVPGLLIGMALLVSRIDNRHVTERRAEQVVRAVEAFHARQGFFPPELRYLVSWSMPGLPEPAIIYGQGWCYKARDDYYTLGYVYHKDWSDPNLVGRVYKSVGDDPAPQDVCNTKIEVLRLQRYVPYVP
jgi:hypothetical protein